MSHDVLQQIDYHAVRAIEELEHANGTSTDFARSAHMELSRLHLYRASWLRAALEVQADKKRSIERALSSALARRDQQQVQPQVQALY